jgi:hypothetical protein
MFKFKQLIAVFLVPLLLVPASARADGEEVKKTIQQQALEIAPGSIVEVRLTNKQTVRGRMGEVDADGFTVTFAKGEKVETKKLAYAEVKSLKEKVQGQKGHNLLAGIGVAFLILLGISLIMTAVVGGKA